MRLAVRPAVLRHSTWYLGDLAHLAPFYIQVLMHLCAHSVVSNSCDSMDCSLPGSSVHGILPAGILEWIAISSSR